MGRARLTITMRTHAAQKQESNERRRDNVSSPDAAASRPATSNSPNKPAAKKVPGRGTGFVVFLALCGVLMIGAFLRESWLVGQRREMFVPDLEAALARRPNNGPLLATLAARRVEATNYRRAAELLRTAVNAGETNAPIWLMWAACEAATGDKAEAREILEYARGAAPHARQEIAAALARLNALPPAASENDAMRAICPAGASPLLDRFAPATPLTPAIEAVGRRDGWTSGFETRRSWAQKEPTNATVGALWADALRRNDRLGEAEAAALRAVALNGTSPEARLALGDVLLQTGFHARAGIQYKIALARKPGWVPALVGLGNFAVETRQVKLALDCFERAVPSATESPNVWIGMGRAHALVSSRQDKALTAFATAARLAPTRTDFFPHYAEAMRRANRATEAEKLLRKRLADKPADARSQFLLATLLLDDAPTPERDEEAGILLRESVARDGGAEDARLRLAEWFLKEKRFSEAIPVLLKGNGDFPKSAQMPALLARAYRQNGQVRAADAAQYIATERSVYAKAVAAAEQKERADASDIATHRKLASIYRAGGEEEKARRQDDMIYYLQRYAEQIKRGVSSVRPTSDGDAPPTR